MLYVIYCMHDVVVDIFLSLLQKSFNLVQQNLCIVIQNHFPESGK